jgi:hypothetical protein
MPRELGVCTKSSARRSLRSARVFEHPLVLCTSNPDTIREGAVTVVADLGPETRRSDMRTSARTSGSVLRATPLERDRGSVCGSIDGCASTRFLGIVADQRRGIRNGAWSVGCLTIGERRAFARATRVERRPALPDFGDDVALPDRVARLVGEDPHLARRIVERRTALAFGHVAARGLERRAASSVAPDIGPAGVRAIRAAKEHRDGGPNDALRPPRPLCHANKRTIRFRPCAVLGGRSLAGHRSPCLPGRRHDHRHRTRAVAMPWLQCHLNLEPLMSRVSLCANAASRITLWMARLRGRR